MSTQHGGRPSKDRGSTSLELVVAFPGVLLLCFGVLQGALWYHARDVASAAAAAGVQAVRAESGTTTSGQQRAASFLAQNGEALLDGRVVATRDATRVSVVVSGHSVSLLPGWDGPLVEQSASGPVERFTSGVTA